MNEEKTNQNKAPMYALNDKNTPPWKGIAFIVLSAFFYSLMSVFVRLSGDLPTLQKAFFRNLVATFVALVLLIKDGSLAPKKGSIPAILGRSIAGTVGIVCNFFAIDNMTIADASILNKLAPFFSVLFSIWILKEKSGWKDYVFVGIAFLGAVFVVKPSFDITKSAPALLGALGGLGAGLAYTFVRYLGKRGERSAVIVFYFSAFSCLAVLPFMLANYQPMTFPQVTFLILAGCAASAAQFSVNVAYTCAPAKEISVYDYSQVLFTAVWGLILFAELPDYISVIGYVIIISAAVGKYLVSKK